VARLEVGAKAPAFTLRNQDGDKVSLSSFVRTRVVLYFYPADDTPGCTKEACQFNDGLLAFKRLGVKVLGISPDNAPAHVAFRKKYGLKFDLLSDPDKSVMAKYGAFGEKMLSAMRFGFGGHIEGQEAIDPEQPATRTAAE